MAEKKTKESQIKATRKYDEKMGLVVIGCKVTKEQKENILFHSKEKGYKSINSYLLALIEKDMNQ